MMRSVELPGTGLHSSRLAMGCASLGSRYGAGASLRGLEQAFAQGVTWFDVAPAYGAGQAEAILSGFLRSHREAVSVCTKVGLAAPSQSALKRLLLPVARPVVARLKKLRGRIRQSGATTNQRLPLTPALIESSIEESLRRLGTDRVEVYALHDPHPEDLARDEVLRALERVRERGLARCLAVAGELPAALTGAALPVFDLIQTADDPATDPLDRVVAAANGRALATVSHSVFGVGGTFARLAQRLEADADARDRAGQAGFAGATAAVAAQLLLARALHANGRGPVLASMLGGNHLAENCAVAARDPADWAAAHALVRRLAG